MSNDFNYVKWKILRSTETFVNQVRQSITRLQCGICVHFLLSDNLHCRIWFVSHFIVSSKQTALNYFRHYLVNLIQKFLLLDLIHPYKVINLSHLGKNNHAELIRVFP